MTTSQAKAVTWNWQQIQTTYTDADCYVKLNERQVSVLLTALTVASWSTRWFDRPANFGEVIDFVGDLQAALLQCIDLPAQTRGEIIRCLIEDYPDELSEEYDAMAKCEIVKFNGIAYAALDCGCGVYEYYPLSSSVEINPDTNAPFAPGQSGGTLPYPEVVNDVNCYSQKATNYMVERFLQYIDFVLTVAEPAVDYALGPIDEVLRLPKIVQDIVNGLETIETVREYTFGAITSAIRSPSVYDKLVDTFPAPGRLNYFRLIRWVTNAPIFVGVIPLQKLMIDWLSVAIFSGFNNDLALLADSCNSGIDVPGVTAPPLSGPIFVLNSGGFDYKVYQVAESYDFDLGNANTQRLVSEFELPVGEVFIGAAVRTLAITEPGFGSGVNVNAFATDVGGAGSASGGTAYVYAQGVTPGNTINALLTVGNGATVVDGTVRQALIDSGEFASFAPEAARADWYWGEGTVSITTQQTGNGGQATIDVFIVTLI